MLTGSCKEQIAGFVPYPGPLFAESFRLDDQWLLERCLELRKEGLLLLGYYHSHPNDSLELSPRDRAGHPPGSLVLVLNRVGEWRFHRNLFVDPGFSKAEDKILF